MSRYRSEYKYECRQIERIELSSRLSGLLEHDLHADSQGMYNIKSLYFDDHKNTCVHENVAGERNRFKYRIRYYGEDKDFLVLERKEKYNSYCLKKSCRINRDTCQRLMTGQVQELLYGEYDELLKKFAVDIITNGFKPKVIIEYDREAFVEPITNVRITFDTNIAASDEVEKFLMPGSYLKHPLKDSGVHILEVKFDDVLPSYIRRVIEHGNYNQQAFSKYYQGRAVCDIKY